MVEFLVGDGEEPEGRLRGPPRAIFSMHRIASSARGDEELDDELSESDCEVYVSEPYRAVLSPPYCLVIYPMNNLGSLYFFLCSLSALLPLTTLSVVIMEGLICEILTFLSSQIPDIFIELLHK